MTFHRTMIARIGEFLAAATISVALSSGAAAAEGTPVGEQLPTRLRELLQEEMRALLVASHEIQDALIMGDSETVADRAQAMHDSFILEQSLSEGDVEVLHSVFPPDFLELDRELHGLAATLAEQARAGQDPAQAQTFGRMIENCVVCHSRYATNMFPMFEEDAGR